MDVAGLHAALIDTVRTWVQTGAEVLKKPYGFIVRDLKHPLVYDSNLAWVEVAPPGGAEQVLDDLDDAFREDGIDHRMVLFADANIAYAEQEAFVAARFRPQADLVMAKMGLPSCIVNPDVDVKEVGLATLEGDFHLIQMALQAESGHTPEVSRQMYDVGRIRREALGERAFVGYLNGEPAATYTITTRGIFADVSNVGTLPRFRMRGIGRTMIFHACTTAASARCEYVLLTADLFDSPQAMYKTLGFEPVGELRGFLRESP